MTRLTMTPFSNVASDIGLLVLTARAVAGSGEVGDAPQLIATTQYQSNDTVVNNRTTPSDIASLAGIGNRVGI